MKVKWNFKYWWISRRELSGLTVIDDLMESICLSRTEFTVCVFRFRLFPAWVSSTISAFLPLSRTFSSTPVHPSVSHLEKLSWHVDHGASLFIRSQVAARWSSLSLSAKHTSNTEYPPSIGWLMAAGTRGSLRGGRASVCFVLDFLDPGSVRGFIAPVLFTLGLGSRVKVAVNLLGRWATPELNIRTWAVVQQHSISTAPPDTCQLKEQREYSVKFAGNRV